MKWSTTVTIDPSWSYIERLHAYWHLNRYGAIYLGEDGKPIKDDREIRKINADAGSSAKQG